MKTAILLRGAVVAVGATLFVLGGAIGVKAADYDIASGRFLTQEEYKKLSKDEAIAYCEQLAQEIDIQNDNAASANSMLGDIDSEIDALKRRLSDARSANEPLSDKVADLERRLRELQELPRSYTVVRGDYLIKISAMRRIYSDETRWKRIFRGNRDKIDDPNLIYPDQIFLIPRGMPSTHTVVEGESLRIIAGYWEVYGDRSQWKRLADANTGVVSDPDHIEPGMVLEIPR
jgi:nucleoid-associated protein YgaU